MQGAIGALQGGGLGVDRCNFCLSSYSRPPCACGIRENGRQNVFIMFREMCNKTKTEKFSEDFLKASSDLYRHNYHRQTCCDDRCKINNSLLLYRSPREVVEKTL